MVSLERPGSPLPLDLERVIKKVKNQDHRENDEDEMVLDETLPKRVSYKEMLMNKSDSKNESNREDDVSLFMRMMLKSVWMGSTLRFHFQNM